MSTFETVFTAAQALPPADRLQLIDALWNSFGAGETPLPLEEWMQEVRRRSEALERGEMTTADWPSVRDRARLQAGWNG